MIPQTQQQYVVRNASITADQITSLHLETASIPPLQENEALVRIHAVSLNHRDILVATGTYIWPSRDGVVPCSDAAGEIVAVGAKVTRFQPGQRVMSNFCPTHVAGNITSNDIDGALGSLRDGVLREYAVCAQDALVRVPDYLSMEEACTLPCAAVTAWNALMGGGQPLRAGETVITQGTGGVSCFAVQIAVAAGAHVVATTSSAAKQATLKKLGVRDAINYRETTDWGLEAKKLANEGQGADFVVEIGGPGTIEQSLIAARIEGVIAIIGRRASPADAQSKQGLLLADALKYPRTLRRIVVGSRNQFEEMNQFFEQFKIRPVIDQTIFAFQDAQQAFEYLERGDQVGKVVIRIVQ